LPCILTFSRNFFFDPIRLNVIPLDPSDLGKKYVDLLRTPDIQGDLPLQLVVSSKYSSFLLTRSGHLYLMEIDNALVYYCVRVSQTSLLHASLGDDGNILTLTCEGISSR